MSDVFVVMKVKRLGSSDEKCPDVKVEEVEVFPAQKRREADALFIRWITEADVEIDGPAHVAALIEDGYCAIVGGAVQIERRFMS